MRTAASCVCYFASARAVKYCDEYVCLIEVNKKGKYKEASYNKQKEANDKENKHTIYI